MFTEILSTLFNLTVNIVHNVCVYFTEDHMLDK